MTQFNGAIEAPYSFDWYSVYLFSGTTYYFEMEGSPTGKGTLADSYLYLYSPSFSFITSDDDGGVGNNSRIVYTATASGWYNVQAKGFSSLAGTYQLNINQDDFRNSVEGVGTAGLVNSYQSLSGTINYLGDHDVFSTNLIAGLSYTIEVRAAGSGTGTLGDSYLYLRNASGALLASDDDAGLGNDSLLTFRPTTTGTYYLDAGAYQDAGTGSYRVYVGMGMGTSASEVIYGTASADVISSNGGDDIVYGSFGNDTIGGGAGFDTLRGQDGNDVLRGSVGADILIGGLGSDTFAFSFASDSMPGARDRIIAGDGAVAFQNPGAGVGDTIDLSQIDANANVAGDQAFLWGGTGAGRLSIITSGTDTVIRGNTDADATFEFELAIADGSVLAAAYSQQDFVL